MPTGRRVTFILWESTEAEEAFVSRLTEAVRAATTPQLLGHVTSTISQSGLAALERASLCNIAVSGGVQDIDYTLAADPVHPDGVIVTLRVYRFSYAPRVDFTQFAFGFRCLFSWRPSANLVHVPPVKQLTKRNGLIHAVMFDVI